MKTLVLGLGNTILSDDGVGIRVAEEVMDRVEGEEVSVKETSFGGLRLLDILIGYDRAVIIDAIEMAEGEAGQILRLTPDDFDAARHLSSIHDVDFATALDLGKRLGMDLPREIVIFAIKVSDITTFSEECTPEVRRAIPVCTEMVLEELAIDSRRGGAAGKDKSDET